MLLKIRIMIITLFMWCTDLCITQSETDLNMYEKRYLKLQKKRKKLYKTYHGNRGNGKSNIFGYIHPEMEDED